MNIVIDIETIPDQSENAIQEIMKDLKVKSPDLTKPKLIDALELGADGKFKTVPELKELWIERFGDDAKYEQAEAKWLKTSFDGGYGEIICICCDIDGSLGIFANKNGEKKMLEDFWFAVSEYTQAPYFVAHNAKFDIPFLWHRSVINGVVTPKHFKAHGRHDSNYYCTMEAWSGFNGKIKLDSLAKILNLGSKTEGMDGSQVWPEYRKGNINKIVDYCVDDVKLTRAIFDRMTKMSGA